MTEKNQNNRFLIPIKSPDLLRESDPTRQVVRVEVSIFKDNTGGKFDVTGEIILPEYEDSSVIVDIRKQKILSKVVQQYKKFGKVEGRNGLYTFSAPQGTRLFILETNNSQNPAVNTGIWLSTGRFHLKESPLDPQYIIKSRPSMDDDGFDIVMADFSKVLNTTMTVLYESVGDTLPPVDFILQSPYTG
ncbi:MAG TPA: hypothetical protein VLF89_01925 [Candidatus Saccharimonadales bacterium]|nr:hypothetical protein [Candidatus Saccharimonadales bacterium]